MDVLWTLLALAFWFVIAFAALLWLAATVFGNRGPKGPVLPLALAIVAGWLAYAMVNHAPSPTDCVEQTPTGSGRC